MEIEKQKKRIPSNKKQPQSPKRGLRLKSYLFFSLVLSGISFSMFLSFYPPSGTKWPTAFLSLYEYVDTGIIPSNFCLLYTSTGLDFQYDIENGEFVFVKAKTQEEAADDICRIFCELVNRHGIEHVQILSPFRSEGLASSDQLNRTIREIVNPIQDNLPDLKVGGNYFRLNDKVMQNKNNGKASNGDIGFIRKIGRNENNELKVTIAFSESRIVEYGMEEMEHMELAYATTIHRAMGSEYDIVILPVIRNHMRMLKRNLIYTAVTRAREKVVLVGQKWVLFQAIHKTADKRNTMLGERICKYAKSFAKQQELKKAS